MDNLFAILILISLFFLLIGIFKPSVSLFWYKKERTRIMSFLIYVGVTIIFFILFGVASDRKVSNNPIVKTISSNKTIDTPQKKITNEEYFNLYNTQLNKIKLEKMFDIAPLYGKYADSLNNVLLDMESKDSIYHIFSNKSIKSLHNKYRKIQDQALSNYIKYGNPDDEEHFFIFATSACKVALEEVLNDPDYDIVKEKYYLKQTSKGYDYKLLIRGKNAFGAKILKEMTFSLQYNPFTKEYDVISVR